MALLMAIHGGAKHRYEFFRFIVIASDARTKGKPRIELQREALQLYSGFYSDRHKKQSTVPYFR